MLLNVCDYASPDEAFAAAQDGDRIYFPYRAAPYTPATLPYWPITKSITVQGDGPGLAGATSGSILMAKDKLSPLFVITPPAGNVCFEDVQLQPGVTGTPSASSVGIFCQLSAGQALSGLSLRRVTLSGFYGDGIHLEGYDSVAAQIDRVTLVECLIRNCIGAGAFIKNCSLAQISASAFEGNQKYGVYAEASDVGIYTCQFSANCGAAAGAYDGNATFRNCTATRVESSRFSNFDTGTIKKALVVDGGIATIVSCDFDSGALSGSSGTGIAVTRTTAGAPLAGPILITGNRFQKTTTLISTDANVVACSVFPQYDLTGTGGASGITLSTYNYGGIGAPSSVRPTGSQITGALVPSAIGDATVGVVEGAISYNGSTNVLRVRIGGVWRTIKTL